MINPALEKAITAKIMEKGICLFVLPDLAIMAQKEAESPTSTVDDLVDIISRDPVIAARLIQVANSAMYRGLQRIDSLNHVVSRLGMRTVGSLIVSLFTQQLFTSKNATLREVMRRQCQISARVAAYSYRLAKEYSKVDPNQALIAGLLHGIGGIPVISIAEEIPKLQQSPVLLDKLIVSLQPQLGQKMMQAWDFPSVFSKVIAATATPEHSNSGPVDICDVVVAAVAKSRGIDRLPNGDPLPAFVKMGLTTDYTVDDEETDEVVRILTDQ